MAGARGSAIAARAAVESVTGVTSGAGLIA
jgi:hypothetical protein